MTITPTTSVSQNTARSKRKIGANGEPCFAYETERFDMVVNKSPQAAQVGTIVVATATNSYTYVVRINGYDVTYIADSSTDKIEVSNGIAAAINIDPYVRGQVSAVADGTDTVTVTGTYPGAVFTLIESDTGAKLTITEAATAAASADAVAFGRLIYTSGYESEGAAKLGTLPKSTNFTAQVDTITEVYASGEVYTVGIKIAGETFEVNVAADTDTNTTATAIRAAINAIMPTYSVACTGSTDQIILTAEKPGESFETYVGLKTGTIARLALVHTTSGPSTSLVESIAGISIVPMDEATASGTYAGQYPPNRGVNLLRVGEVWVSNSETTAPVFGGSVYVETSGSSAGLLYAATGNTRIKLPKSIATWRRVVAADGLASVRINAGLN